MARQKVNGNRIRSAGNPDEEPNLALYPVCPRPSLSPSPLQADDPAKEHAIYSALTNMATAASSSFGASLPTKKRLSHLAAASRSNLLNSTSNSQRSNERMEDMNGNNSVVDENEEEEDDNGRINEEEYGSSEDNYTNANSTVAANNQAPVEARSWL
jgi:hypothetical protein